MRNLNIPALAFFITLILPACGKSKSSDDVTLQRIDDRIIEIPFADPKIGDEIAIGRPTLHSLKGANNNYLNNVAFKITNLLSYTRCFMKVTLSTSADGTKTEQSYVISSLKKSVDSFPISTNSCLGANESGFVVFYIVDSRSELEGLKIASVESSLADDTEWVDDKSVQIMDKRIQNSNIFATLKNETVADGFNHIGNPQWLMTSGDLVIQSGFLFLPTNFAKDRVIGQGEQVEIWSSWDNLMSSIPKEFELQIFPDEVSKQ